MMMFETSKHVPKTEKRCCVFKVNRFICANKTKLMSVFNESVPIIDNEFRHHIVKVVCGSTRLSPRGSTATLTM